MRRIPALAVAAATTGAGKTTVAVGLMAALRRRGLRVQPFKVGPDFIDPGHHAAAAGRPSRNLDTWMLPPATVRRLFARAIAGADAAVVEGVMGLYDGASPASDAGSTAEAAALLGVPVVVVLDGYTAARTLAAVALGLDRFDPRRPVAGFIVNRLAPGGYADALAGAIAAATGRPVFGFLAPDPAIAVPERHLGLRPAAEGAAWIEAAARAVEAGLDLDALCAACSVPAPAPAAPAAAPPHPPRARLAVARDAAFHFYYEDGLDLLRTSGLELVPWSPLADTGLPPDCDGVYLGGGFPERFAAGLAANGRAREAVSAAARAGLPVWGECGGFMYLCRVLVDTAGRAHPMAGVVPARAVMTARAAGFGYREARARRDSLLLREGETARGHEFHWSRAEWDNPALAAAEAPWTLARAGGGGEPVADGYAAGSVLAGYVHLHLCGAPALAARLAAGCVQARARRRGSGAKGGARR